MHIDETSYFQDPDIGIDIIVSLKRLATTFVLFDKLKASRDFQNPRPGDNNSFNGEQRMYLDIKLADIMKKLSCYKTCCQCTHPFQDIPFHVYEGEVDTISGNVVPSSDMTSTLIFSKFGCCPPFPLCGYLPLYSAQVYHADGDDKHLKYDITSKGGVKWNVPCCCADAPIVIDDSNNINIGSLSGTKFCILPFRDISYDRLDNEGALFRKFILDICACWGKRGHPVGFKRIDCCFCCSPPFSKETIEIKKGFGNLGRLDNDAWLWLTFFEEVVYPYSQGGGGGGGNGGGGGGGGG